MEEQTLESGKELNKQRKENENKNPNINDIEIPQYKAVNDEFLQSVDQGMCMSMHQPYASLLVAGIKKLILIQVFTCNFALFQCLQT